MYIKQKIKLIFAIIVFTAMAVSLSLWLDYKRVNQQFITDVTSVNRIFTQRIASIETVLISLTGLHYVSDDLNQAELSGFSDKILKAYPFIDAILGMEKIETSEIVFFERRMQKQGYVNLQLTSINEKPSSMRIHYPIYFVEPITPITANLLGLDITTSEQFMDKINQAITSGHVVASRINHALSKNKPEIVIFKALYSGRYPPQNRKERLSSVVGLVALKINIERFMSYLKDTEFNLQGNLSNLDKASSVTENKEVNQYSTSLGLLSYTNQLHVYGQAYQLVIHRSISLKMISFIRMFMFWLFFMMFLGWMIFTIKKREQSAREIRYLAYNDSLTRLPNRAAFKEKLHHVLQAVNGNEISGAIIFMDIDEFKRINDTLGHDVGDELLKQFAKRLTSHIRSQDSLTLNFGIGSDGLVTRLGGDEFTLLLTKIENKRQVSLIVERIKESINEPFTLKSHEVYVTSSIGIALFPCDGEDVEQLLKHADIAMYYAKAHGKNNFQFYAREMSAKVEGRLALEGKLHQAIAHDELCLYYQPQIDTKTNKIVAAEALLRWNQRDLGMILPNDFISIAEETGQILAIGDWVINEACRQVKVWEQEGLGSIRVAVNLSSLQFIQDDLTANIINVLRKNNLDSKYLELEITETLMMKHFDETIVKINELSDIGIGVSIDDFGTGYSSLSYLKKFQLEAIKIDRSFVSDIPEDEDDMMITSAIISMAKNLNLKIIAEGVETKQQMEFLKEQQCDFLQGYYFSKPLPAEQFKLLLKDH